VNGVAGDVVILRLLGDGDVWIPVGALEATGLQGVGGSRSVLDGVEGVRLRSLAPDLTFAIDESKLELNVTATSALLGRTAVDAGGGARRPERLQTGGSPSAFVNYAVQGDDQRQVSAFGEMGAGAGGWLASSGVSRPATGSVVRGLSALTLDEPERLRRWVAGDAVVTAGALGGSLVLGGLGVEREFSLDPWFVRQPLARTSAVALTPSTLEVYVNDRLVRRETVTPGTLDLSNLPLEAGAGQVRTVLRDAYGRSQEVTTSYYTSAGLLAAGTSDYGFHAGFRRDAIGTSSKSYSDFVGLGRWRGGLTDRLTLGGRLEAGKSLVSGGPAVTLALPLGEVELAASGGAGGGGAAGLASWSYTSRHASGGVRLQAMSRAYANASLAAGVDRPLTQASVFAGLPVGRFATVGAEANVARSREGFDSESATLRASTTLGHDTTILASVGWARDGSGTSGPTASLLLTWVLGERTTGNVQADRSATARSTGSVGVQRSLQNGPGYGYRLDAASGDGSVTAAELQAQGDHGRIEALYQRAGGRGTGWATGSGGIVFMGGDAFFTRAIQDGYALVQVPGVEGVRTYLNSLEVGRTDARGNVLVPGLLPYNANRVSIRPADVPIDYDLDAFEQLVAPPRRVGAQVRFEVRRIQTVTGTLSIAEPAGDVTPAYGELRVQGAKESSPLGSNGRFYLTALEPGRHAAEVEYGGGVCRFPLDVPASTAALTDVGAIRCVAGVTSKVDGTVGPIARASP
jgi:outer membrane usher protein